MCEDEINFLIYYNSIQNYALGDQHYKQKHLHNMSKTASEQICNKLMNSVICEHLKSLYV